MNKIINIWFKKNKDLKKSLILILISLGIFLITFILWTLLFSKYYIFSNEEKIFLDAAKKYYEYRPELLPNKGETREITLEKMFLEDRIESLYIPKTDTLCDTTSWVKVYKDENNEYQYYTYLKCGKYVSNIDHEGPTIELNGDKRIIVNYGVEYKDPGVKSVVDNYDGKMDVNKVEIDTSKVNVNKVGTYQVTYKIKDKLNNQTKVTRTVIVAKNLTEIAKQKTDDSNYYKGQVEDNYVLFSGMLWQIINVNEDGTIKLISADIVSNLRYTGNSYKDSNIDIWLNKVFLPSISSSKYLVDTTYCVGNIPSLYDLNNICSETIKAKVGMLSLDEYNKTLVDGYSPLNNKNTTYITLANKVNGQTLTVDQYRQLSTIDEEKVPPIKPVITIKANVYITSGEGSKSDPYKLEDYSYAKEHDKINTRIIGEYFNYSGMTFRVTGLDSKNNVKAIMATTFMNNSTNNPLEVSITGLEHYSYNVKDENNPGYILNNILIDYIDESNLISAEYKLITNSKDTTYDKFKTEKVTAKLMLASTTDLFSGLNINLDNSTKKIQLFADKTDTADTLIMLNVLNGVGYQLPIISYSNYAVKALTVFNGNLKIKSGKGTYNNPYILK